MSERILLYLIGAKGNIGLTTAVGLHALVNEKTATTGLVSELPEFADKGLPKFEDFVVAGADPNQASIVERLRALSDGNVIDHRHVGRFAEEGTKLNGRIDKGIDLHEDEGTIDELVNQAKDAMLAASVAAGADRIIVVNVGTTEPAPERGEAHNTFEALLWHVHNNQRRFFTNAMLYALAAGRAGAAYINFTPSIATEIPALVARFAERGLPLAGKDGKTGETLLKTVLAPMFVARNVKVMSWLANNYLGNGDGEALNEHEARSTKLVSKNEALRSILGEEAHLSTDIGYAPSLGDWKTAWDLIHFKGFLETPMTMQFTWQGCDSALAAPLVIDLARFVAWAWQQGEGGELAWLASFFKSPQGSGEHEFFKQLEMLKARFA
ncbi:MAG: inositol-3-phosphate synthase [Planctomycetes bacterium]|nr:inositol-3-phosphate synthase [Planctomycetota bacterium]